MEIYVRIHAYSLQVCSELWYVYGNGHVGRFQGAVPTGMQKIISYTYA